MHEAVITGDGMPDPAEIAWHDWLTEPALREAVRRGDLVPGGREAFTRYAALA